MIEEQKINHTRSSDTVTRCMRGVRVVFPEQEGDPVTVLV